MTFIVQGINGSEVMPLGTLFKPEGVTKTEAVSAEHPIDENEQNEATKKYAQQVVAENAYRAVDDLPQVESVLYAEQIMTSPVTTMTAEMTINDAASLFRSSTFRHLPVISADGRLVGIVSDRDILHQIGGIGENYQPLLPHNLNDNVASIMQTPVLTASRDTDVRHIARLFVSQHVGAMPIIEEERLTGIITRNDILEAVMSNFLLELWA